MFDEPAKDSKEAANNPKTAAQEKADELRMYAELAAAFEGTRKHDAAVVPGLDPKIARDVQQTIGRLEKARLEAVLIPPEQMPEAQRLLSLYDTAGLTTNDYHVARRPGEAMIVRWIDGEQVDAFYARYQAHFDSAIAGYREDARQATAWKQDPKSLAYLDALDAINPRLSVSYGRDFIKKHPLALLTTQAADELNIGFLCDDVMGIAPAELVGRASAPAPGSAEAARGFAGADDYAGEDQSGGDAAGGKTEGGQDDTPGDDFTPGYDDDDSAPFSPPAGQGGPGDRAAAERDLAWFFKMFALRGRNDAGTEQMCFFTFLQKSSDSW